jgi:hypothetical protein
MINVIVASFSSCSHDVSDESACGMAVGKLTAHVAGLSAASGGVVQECPNPIQKSQNLVMRDSLRAHGAGLPLHDPKSQAICAVDLKGSMNQIYAAATAIRQAERRCEEVGHCVYDALDVVSAFAGMGKFMMGALGHCYDGKLPLDTAFGHFKNFPITCSEHVTNLVHQLTGFIADADELVERCHHSPSTAARSVGRRRRRRKDDGSFNAAFMQTTTGIPTQVVVVPVAADGTPIAASKLYKTDGHKDCQGGVCKPKASFITPAVGLVGILPIASAVSFVAGMKRASQNRVLEQYRDMELVAQTDTED